MSKTEQHIRVIDDVWYVVDSGVLDTKAFNQAIRDGKVRIRRPPPPKESEHE